MTDQSLLKVFIVEDELLIRESLRNLLVTYEEPHQIVYAGEASDGEIALSMMREIKPDILLTDIRMPFMDGLTLAKYAKELFPWLHVVIISGHQDFEYLQEAITVGVDGYLTKPILSKELDDVLKRIRGKREKKLLEQSNPLNQEIMIDFEYYKEHFVKKLKEGKYSADDLFEREKRLTITFVGKTFTILTAKLEPLSANKPFYYQLITRFSELFQADDHVLLTIFDNFTMVGIIAGNSFKESLNKAYYVADIIQYELRKQAIETFLIGIGSTTNRLSELASAIQKSEDALALTSFSPQQQIVELTVPSSRVPKEFSVTLMKLLEAESLNIPEILKDIETIQITDKTANPLILNQAILDTFFLWIKQMDETSYDELTQEYSSSNLEMICQTPTLFKLTSRLLLEEVERLKKQERTDGAHSRADLLIQKCVDYLRENYNNPNLSLQFLADHLELSPAYLSTIFSQIEGITFIDYLTNIRMEQAKKLLTETQHKIIDITFEIGYNDPNYFSFTFKKRNGLSPKEYRKQHTKKASHPSSALEQ